MYSTEKIRQIAPDVAKAIENEVTRQRTKIELIASENFVSEAVMDAMGTPLTNKYAEGYPGKRYYGGCEFVDVVETIAKGEAELQGQLNMLTEPVGITTAELVKYSK